MQVIQYSPTAVCCDSARSTCGARGVAFEQRSSERDTPRAASRGARGTRPALVAAQRLHDEQVVQLVPAFREVHLFVRHSSGT